SVYVFELVIVYHCIFFFFFSSRRRHTRFSRDWSSDVCSSDLCSYVCGLSPQTSMICGVGWNPRPHENIGCASLPTYRVCPGISRSEERRVGKERDYRIAQYNLQRQIIVYHI